jgi:hypothetical protein
MYSRKRLITTVDLSNVRRNPHDLARMVRPKSNRAQERSSIFTVSLVSLALFQPPGQWSNNCPSTRAIHCDVAALTSIKTPKTPEDGCQHPSPVSSHADSETQSSNTSLLGPVSTLIQFGLAKQ